MKITRPLIGKFLDISTSHITKKDARLLDRTVGSNPLIVYKYPEGFFVLVPEKFDRKNKYFHQELALAKKFGYSKALLNILRKAYAKNCWFVRLDCDGTVYSDLPTFKW